MHASVEGKRKGSERKKKKDSKPDIIDLFCQLLQKDRSGLGVEDELASELAAGVGADDRNVLTAEHVFGKLDVALADVHERIRNVQDDAPAEDLGAEIPPARTKLQQLFHQLRDGDVPVFRRSQPLDDTKRQHVMIDAAPAPDAVPEADRHTGAENGRDEMALLVYENAAGKEVMAVLIWIIKHCRISLRSRDQEGLAAHSFKTAFRPRI